MANHENVSTGKTTSLLTHLQRFRTNLTLKFHEKSSSKLHRFWKANPCADCDINSTWIRISKSTKYGWVSHVDFSMSFRRRIDVISVLLTFLLWRPILSYSGIVLSRCNFNNIDVITDIGTIGTIGNISFGYFFNNANK